MINPNPVMTGDNSIEPGILCPIPLPFEIDDYTRWRLMEGLDDIGLTLRHEPDVAAFESRRASWLPVTL